MSSQPEQNDATQEPPRTLGGTIRKLGPGLIIAGSIVGSGELIATTKVGAQAGISLLWLILVGCIIKVFCQIELGRYAITSGKTTLRAMLDVPVFGVFVFFYWFVMFTVGLGQLGGIVGGVGQSLAISLPLTSDYKDAVEVPSVKELQWYVSWRDGDDINRQLLEAPVDGVPRPIEEQTRIERGFRVLENQLEELGDRGERALLTTLQISSAEDRLKSVTDGDKEQLKDEISELRSIISPRTLDDKYWAAAVAFFTIALLYRGRYGMIQTVSTALVVGFTFITIGNVIALQSAETWKISIDQIVEGFSFRLKSRTGGLSDPLATALSTFGIIGVGGSELVMYPYWCLEKGYGKWVGPRTEDNAWAERARGWIKVMNIDCWLSMCVYTIATLAFFIMGVAVLHNEGRDPEGMRMVSTLATAYVPVFGSYARWLFLAGAIAVLYSTFLVSNAGHARVVSDWFRIARRSKTPDQARFDRHVSILSVVLPLVCLTVYCIGADPVALVLLSGTMQSIMLPLLAFTALYFRFKLSDKRLISKNTVRRIAWDIFLVLSSLGMLVTGSYSVYKILLK